MKAVYVTEYGDLESLVYGERPPLEIHREEVLVRMRASSLNRRDLFAREGSHGTRRERELPRVLGLDGAGDVVEVGDGVPNLRIGDRVLGVFSSGSHAEYAKAHYSDLYNLPENLSYTEGASIPVVFSTAWHLLICKSGLRLGEDVLIMSAGSGVGIAAIQIAKKVGCRVFTTASSEQKLQYAKDLGADEGINYSTEDFSDKVLDLTNGRGVDVVLDHIGASVWEQCFASLKTGGRFINCGVTAGYRADLHLGKLWTRDLTIMGSSMRPREDLPKLLPLFQRGDLKAVVAKTFPLEQAILAHSLLESSDFFGKVILIS